MDLIGENAVYVKEFDISWALSLLKDMISIPTINPPGINYDKFSSYTANVMKLLGLDVEVIEVPKDVVANSCDVCKDYPRYIVVGRIGSGRPVIHFNGHYDVVPPGDGWRYDPFKPLVEENRVYGRGSVDMKGGITSMFLAIKIFTSIFKDFKGTIEIALVPDEEIGGVSGTGYLIKSLSKLPDHVIIAEGNGSNNILIGHKGALWGYIEIYGKQAHGSTPWRGVNAFEYMAKIALKFLEKHSIIIQNKVSKYDYEDPEGVKPTLNLGGEVRGSIKINIVPGYYAFSFDRRIIPEERLDIVEEELKKLIEDLVHEFPEVKIGFRIISRLNPALTKEDSVLVKNLEQSIESILNVKPKKIICLGVLDMHYYVDKGIETVAYGPGPAVNAHAVNEYVLIDEVINVANVYVELMTKLLKITSQQF